jgi:5-methylcytosine-specific restriction endonuclease McrA
MTSFVLNKDKLPLSPCGDATARKLLDSGKAIVHKLYPFTIRLKEQKDSIDKSDFKLKIDYGSKHTGLAILNKNKVLWLAQIHHKTNIKSNMDSRRALRRGRRTRHTRYRQARFNNRRRPEGWLPPSLQSRVDNILHWVDRLRKLCPITSISYENIKFDTQLMQNPEISGIEYQQGELQGYEVREYLLEKWGRKCAYCGAENIPLEIEHIIPRSRGGSNRVSNLSLACNTCN